MESKNPVSVMFDSCTLISLCEYFSFYYSDDRNSPDSLKSLLINKQLDYEQFKDMPFRLLPDFLKDDFFGIAYEGVDGVIRYQNIENYDMMRRMVESGKLQIVISKSIEYEMNLSEYDVLRNFVKNYVQVININKADEDMYQLQKKLLATKYQKTGAMRYTRDSVDMQEKPDADAYHMADASICGYDFVTDNARHFVYETTAREDNEIRTFYRKNGYVPYKKYNDTRRIKIHKINDSEGRLFENSNGKFLSVSPITVSELIINLKRYYKISQNAKDKDDHFKLRHKVYKTKNNITGDEELYYDSKGDLGL